MSDRLDELLKQTPATSDVALSRARDRLRGELSLRHPTRRWRLQAALLFATAIALVAIVAGALLIAGQIDRTLLLAHLPVLAVLTGAGAIGAYAALRPFSRATLSGALTILLGAVVALVFLRGSGDDGGSTPEWVCTATHLAVGVAPVFVALRFLTGASPSVLRSAVAGLAVGVTGAAVGELACGRGWRHVLVFHVSAWVVVAVATVAGRSVSRTRSFAP